LQHIARHQWQGGGLQEDGGQHQLRFAAGGADDQIEPVGGTGAAEPQRPLLQGDGDAERGGKGDQKHDDQRARPETAQIGEE
jgi:hypothetical protein